MANLNKQSDSVKLAVIGQKVDDLRDDIKEVKNLVGTQYVTMDKFLPVQRLVYGLVALILASVFGAIIAVVLV